MRGTTETQRLRHGPKWIDLLRGFPVWLLKDVPKRGPKRAHRSLMVRAKLVEKPERWPYSSASYQFDRDTVPERFLSAASGVKAPLFAAQAPGLKPRPPKEGPSVSRTRL